MRLRQGRRDYVQEIRRERQVVSAMIADFAIPTTEVDEEALSTLAAPVPGGLAGVVRANFQPVLEKDERPLLDDGQAAEAFHVPWPEPERFQRLPVPCDQGPRAPDAPQCARLRTRQTLRSKPPRPPLLAPVRRPQ